MLRRQRVEIGPRQPPDLAVAQGGHAARAFALGQQGHFTHDIARRDLGDQARLLDLVLLVPEDAETAAGHEVDRIGGFAPAKQRHAARQAEQPKLSFDCREASGVQFGKEGSMLQRLAKPQARGVLVRGGDAHPRRLTER